MSGLRVRGGRIGTGVALVAAFLLGSATYGAVQFASAAGSGTTYYGCVTKGALSKVGTKLPTCAKGATLISWNSKGQPGTPGTNGTNGTSMTVSVGAPTGTCTSGDSDMAATGEVYICKSGAWSDTGVSLKGATGALGLTGPQGPQGVTANTCTSIPGPNENFSFCTLSPGSPGTDLAFVDLENTLLIQTQLSYAYMNGANLDNANLSQSDLVNANLDNANLTNAELNSANLENADLYLTNLTDADLSNANLTGAGMIGANVTGVTWSDTGCPDGTLSNSDGNTCVGHGA
jgi:hypothetical protein